MKYKNTQSKDIMAIQDYLNDVSHSIIVIDKENKCVKIKSFFSLQMLEKNICEDSDNFKATARFKLSEPYLNQEQLLNLLSLNTFYRIFTVENAEGYNNDYFLVNLHSVVKEDKDSTTNIEYNLCDMSLLKNVVDEYKLSNRKFLPSDIASKLANNFTVKIEKLSSDNNHATSQRINKITTTSSAIPIF